MSLIGAWRPPTSQTQYVVLVKRGIWKTQKVLILNTVCVCVYEREKLELYRIYKIKSYVDHLELGF